MKQASVYFRNQKAGTLREDADGYTFTYDEQYLSTEGAKAISLTLPLREKLTEAT